MAASLSFQATATNGTTGTSFTLSFTVASAAGSERLLALGSIAGSITSNPTYSSVTIDGQTATQVGSYFRRQDSGGGNVGPILSFWRAPGTSGTSINVSVTSTHSAFSLYGVIWTLAGGGTFLASASDSALSVATLTVSANTVTDGVAAACALSYSSSPTPTHTWTGVTEVADGINVFGPGDESFSAASANIGSGSTPLSITSLLSSMAGGGTNEVTSALSITLNPSAGGGTTLAADAGSYAITGSDAGLVASSSLVADAGAYALTGSDVTFATGGNVTFFCASGEYTSSGSAVTFPGAELPPEPQPSPGAGGYAGALYRPYRFGKKRKKEDEEPPAPVYPPDLPPPPRSPSPPDLPAPPLHTMLDLAPPRQKPPPRQTKAKPTVADDDDDGEAIALLLKLLS